MRKGWERIRLDELCQIELGKTPYRGNKSFWDTGKESKNVWLSIADMLNTEGNFVMDSKEYITDNAAKISKIVKKGTLLLSFKLTLGRLAFAGRDLFTNEAIAALAIKNEKVIDKYFLYHFLSFFDWNSASEGDVKVKGKTLNKAKLKEIIIPLPPLSEQQEIVSILDDAFESIERAKSNAEQNLKNAKELLKSYIEDLFQNVNSKWELKTLNEISENLDSKRVPITKNVRSEGLIPYYGASGIVDYVAEYLFNEDLLCVSEDGANLLARTYPIAFSISGKTCVNNHAHVLKFKNLDTQKFVEIYLNSIKIDDYVSGMAQPKLNQAMLNKIPITYPPIDEQKSIVNKIEVLSIETKRLESIYQQKLKDLEELKKSILQKAFNGELKTSKISA